MNKKVVTMKIKIISLVLSALALCGALSGCKTGKEKPTVLCTVFPVYDWVREVARDSENIEIKLLVSDGADLHSFQPTAKDAIAIRSADLVVRVGGVDDSFVNELTKKGDGLDLRLMEAEGVTLCHSSISTEHTSEDAEGHGHHHEHPTDEHIWLSPRNAVACVAAICEALTRIDPEGREIYERNAERYTAELRELDRAYAETVAECDEPRMVVADRFPFVYLAGDYGIEYEAAFEGCTTDAEAGFDTVLRLAERVSEWQSPCVFVTESSDKKLARAVCDAAKDEPPVIVTLDSMQSVTKKDIEDGTSYIGIMQKNLSTLASYLSILEEK